MLNGTYPTVLAHSETTEDVVNTTDETTLFTYTIPGGSLAAGDRLRLRAAIDALNNSGGNVNHTHKFYVGASEILASTTIVHGSSADRRKGFIDVELVVVPIV